MRINHKKRGVVYFEDITFLHYPLVKIFLYLGYEVVIFDFQCDLKKFKWIKKLIDEEVIRRVYIQPDTREHGQAIEVTEEIFEHFKNHKLVQESVALYKNADIAINFKKLLVDQVFRCIYVSNYLKNIQSSLTDVKFLYFIPLNYKSYARIVDQFSSFCLESLDRFRMPAWYTWLIPLIHFWERLKYYIGAMAYVFVKAIFLRVGTLPLHKKQLKSQFFEYAVAIDMFRMHGVFTNDRAANFLLNNKDINKENTVFVINCPVSREWLKFYKDNGFNFINTLEVDRFSGLTKFCYNGTFVKDILKAVGGMRGVWNVPPVFLQVFFINLRTFFNWGLVQQRITFRHYIYSNQESAQQSARNILIRMNGGKSWSYAFCLGGGYLYSDGKNLEGCRNIYWSFLCFDYYVGMNEIVGNYYKLHHQKVEKYFSVGSIYSEMIREIISTDSKKNLFREHFGKDIENKNQIIAFFDTTFIDAENCNSTYEDCIAFYQDILRLVDSMEDVLVIVKPSKLASWFISPEMRWASPKKGKMIIELWNVLKSNPRIFWAANEQYNDQLVLNNIIIAISDLVVTHAMSSPTAEALGVRKKAIWYKSKNSGPRRLYDGIPGLVVYGYAELEKRVKSLLCEVNDEGYDAYLDKYVKGGVEASLDGLAVTKFRQLLKSTTYHG